MSLSNEKYKTRLIDDKINKYLSVIGALSIEGPKWCGKTWTALNHGKTSFLLDDKTTKDNAKLDVSSVLTGDKPVIIDEWSEVPEIWDAVRRKCDEFGTAGNYILTCSTKLTTKELKEKVSHSGAGRIGKIKMYPMSLYESGESTGKASIMDMYNGTLETQTNKPISIRELAYYIVRGGWPQNINNAEDVANILPSMYINNILDKDIHDDKKRDRNKMLTLLKSLARNESSICSNNTLLNDIDDYGDILESRITLTDYLDALTRLHIIENQEPYSSNYRSPKRLSKGVKRHLVDPSLACAVLNITVEKLLGDLNTFGLFFESLVERDLKIYIETLDGNLYHFRDSVSGLEVDSILEFPDGEYAAIEIKLGANAVDEAIKNLVKFSDSMVKKPKFMCVIVGNSETILRDNNTGIYVVPFTALKP